MSTKPASPRLPLARRPGLSACLGIALCVAGWAAAGGSRAAAHPQERAVTRPVLLPGIPHPSRWSLPSPVVPAAALPSAAEPTRTAAVAVPYATLSASTATLRREDALKDIPFAVHTPAGAELSVAALDLDDGRRAVHGAAGSTYDTASIVKVDVLAALLLRAQDAGRALTADERTHASAMIRASDNDATDALWNAVGGAAGLDRANRRLGLRHTAAGAAGEWGLTRTTTADQLVLLAAVYRDGRAASPLTAASRSYVRGLMAAVEADQRWGVSAGGTVAGLKNGWLPRSTTGRWDINSIGLVTRGGHRVLLAALSAGNRDMPSGVALVEKAARAAVAALGLPDA